MRIRNRPQSQIIVKNTLKRHLKTSFPEKTGFFKYLFFKGYEESWESLKETKNTLFYFKKHVFQTSQIV